METPLAEALVAVLADDLEGPAGRAERMTRLAILDAAIAELPLVHRDVIRLFYQEECKYREIAESEQVPIGTIKSRLSGALRRLRVSLAAREEELL